ncbi:MAG TPA: ribonuclease III, partial [Acidimicrobiales bacterium]|nr:ribonuclease III [Acidimicrobiales bacterium]
FDALAPHVAEVLRRLAEVAREGADQLGGRPADVPEATTEPPEPDRPERTTAKVVAADPTVSALAARIGHEFADPGLLIEALTHRSWCAEHDGSPSNERLEFLGDAVLGLVVAEHLYAADRSMPEGGLAMARAAVVSTEALSKVAAGVQLGEAIRLGKGEDATGGRSKRSILADTMEAVIGAVFLDAGLDAARAVILPLLEDRLAGAVADPGEADHKTRLQEASARRYGQVPRYEVSGTGPDHERLFTAIVRISGQERGRGEGRSKKEAEQAAAQEAFRSIRDESGPGPDSRAADA